MAEGARLESVFRGNSNVGSNPTLSASILLILWNPEINMLPDKPSTCLRSYARKSSVGAR